LEKTAVRIKVKKGLKNLRGWSEKLRIPNNVISPIPSYDYKVDENNCFVRQELGK
jgi:hypothetical protein